MFDSLSEVKIQESHSYKKKTVLIIFLCLRRYVDSIGRRNLVLNLYFIKTWVSV